VARPAGTTRHFGPAWLARRLGEVLPDFPERRLCVAFSGGADSTALLAALSRLPRRPAALRAIYVNHRLQRAASAWGRHCRAVAAGLGVPLEVRAVRAAAAPGESPEAAARAARYRLLAAQLAPGEALLTAHHELDQLETVLLQLLRGAGIAGLAAMPACAPFARGLLVRPLLGVTRVELRGWLEQAGIAWVEDPSNADTRLDRNYLRREILPPLLARWPGAGAAVARAARHAAEAQRLLDALGAADAARASHGTALAAAALRALPPARRRNALRFWIARSGYLAPPARRLEEIAGPLLAARPDAHPEVAWSGARVQREAELLVVRAARGAAGTGRAPAAARTAAARTLLWEWRTRRRCALGADGGTLSLQGDRRGPLDLDALGARLSVRRRRGGERLRPVRGGARRALKSLLQEARVPLAERARMPLVFAGEHLIAVADRWLDESVQATAASTRRARLTWTPPPHS
jgi:tRNA(Ile)-lysidine synthase